VPSFSVLVTAACLLCLGIAREAAAQTTSFSYQGRLVDNGAVANGWYDLRFLLYPVANTGSPMGTNAMAVYVSSGLFRVSLDFGSAAFTGPDPIWSSWDRWLEIGVRTNGSSGPYTTLVGRQPITRAPYAIYAADSGKLGGLGASSYAPASGSPVYLSKAGDTMTGNLQVNGTITANALSSFNNLALELNVNNARALRLEPNSASPNVIAGYGGNLVSNGFYGATIAGGGMSGFPNRIGAVLATIGGGDGNQAGGYAAVIAGGNQNAVDANGSYAAIGGGQANAARAMMATVGGGYLNLASGQGAVIGGGSNNTNTESNATIGGGFLNTAAGADATIGGGYSNLVSVGFSATVSGGEHNVATGNLSTVSGGQQ